MVLNAKQLASFRHHKHNSDQIIDPDTGEPIEPGGAPSTSGPVLLEQHTASSSASLDFTDFISVDHDVYEFSIVDLLPSTNSVALAIRVHAGGGFVSAAKYTTSGWAWIHNSQAAFGNNLGALATTMSTSNAADISNAAGGGISGQLRLFNPSQAVGARRLMGQFVWHESGNSQPKSSMCSFGYQDTLAITGIQFLFSSGNISSGTVRVYGLEK